MQIDVCYIISASMKGEIISQIELVLPATVVEACYKLKRSAGSKFRALDKTAGTASDIVLFKQTDDSVCIKIAVARITADKTEVSETRVTYRSSRSSAALVKAQGRQTARRARGLRGKWLQSRADGHIDQPADLQAEQIEVISNIEESATVTSTDQSAAITSIDQSKGEDSDKDKTPLASTADSDATKPLTESAAPNEESEMFPNAVHEVVAEFHELMCSNKAKTQRGRGTWHGRGRGRGRGAKRGRSPGRPPSRSPALSPEPNQQNQEDLPSNVINSNNQVKPASASEATVTTRKRRGRKPTEKSILAETDVKTEGETQHIKTDKTRGKDHYETVTADGSVTTGTDMPVNNLAVMTHTKTTNLTGKKVVKQRRRIIKHALRSKPITKTLPKIGKRKDDNPAMIDISPKKPKKTSDKLAKIWGRKRKRRSRKSKSGDEGEGADQSELLSEDQLEQAASVVHDSVVATKEQTVPGHNAFVENVPPVLNISDVHKMVDPVSETSEKPSLIQSTLADMREETLHTAPYPNQVKAEHISNQTAFQTWPGMEFTQSDSHLMPHQQGLHRYPQPYITNSRFDQHTSELENQLVPLNSVNENYMQTNSGFQNSYQQNQVSQHMQHMPQQGFSNNVYHTLNSYNKLDSIESNMNMYRPDSGYMEMDGQVNPTMLTHLSHATDHTDGERSTVGMTGLLDDHLKLPQKKRPMARQMANMEMGMGDWDAGTMMMQQPADDVMRLDPINSIKDTELEESVQTLQNVMASGSNITAHQVQDVGMPAMMDTNATVVTDNAPIAKKTDVKTLMKLAKGETKRRVYKREYVIECKICQVKLKDYGYLFRHVSKLHKDNPLHQAYLEELRPKMRTPCHICGKMVSCISNLSSHIRQKHSDTTDRTSCPLCQKTYKTAVSLRQHIRLCHSNDEKRYTCHICEAKFAERRGLNEHINCSHETTEVFNCDICGKSFLTKGRLRRHNYIHGEFRHKCEHCGKGFHLKDNMNKHIQIVHEKNLSKRFECQYCNKKFSVKGNMMQHVMGVHLKKYQYNCSVCNSGFRRKGDLSKHIEQKHPDVVMVHSPSGNASRSATPSLVSNSGSLDNIPSGSSTPTLSTSNDHQDLEHTQVLSPNML